MDWSQAVGLAWSNHRLQEHWESLGVCLGQDTALCLLSLVGTSSRRSCSKEADEAIGLTLLGVCFPHSSPAFGLCSCPLRPRSPGFFQTSLLFTSRTFLYHSQAFADFSLSVSVFFVKEIVVNERFGNVRRLGKADGEFCGATGVPLCMGSPRLGIHSLSAHFPGNLVIKWFHTFLSCNQRGHGDLFLTFTQQILEPWGARYYVSLQFWPATHDVSISFWRFFCLVSILSGSLQRCYLVWSAHCLRRQVVKCRAPPVPETWCHLPGGHSCCLLASGLEFPGTCSLVLPHSGNPFGNLFPADSVQNYRGVSPRVTSQPLWGLLLRAVVWKKSHSCLRLSLLSGSRWVR